MKAPERVVVNVADLVFGDDVAHQSFGRVRVDIIVPQPTGDIEVFFRRPRDNAVFAATFLSSARVVVVR